MARVEIAIDGDGIQIREVHSGTAQTTEELVSLLCDAYIAALKELGYVVLSSNDFASGSTD